jgi:3-oxoacyl-[acyl-carrier protein] reductase
VDLGLSGKVAALTGASRGLGLAIARSLAGEGCSVAICGRNEAGLVDAARQLSTTGAALMTHRCDLLAPGQAEGFVEATAQRFGGLDILVHNVGGAGGRSSLDTADQEYLDGVILNAVVGLRASRAAVPLMRARGAGRIVFIASVYGRESGGRPAYNLGKAAEISLAKSLARELAPDRITVNAVAPGSLMFPGSSWERRQQLDPDGIAAFVRSDLPLGRFGTPEEVSAVVAFLCSEQASLVSGACWTVDGGQSRSLI